MFQALVAFSLFLACSYAEFECGVPKVPIIENAFGKRIVGGWEAKPHSIPWQVYLMTFKDERSYGACGGSLVQPTPGKNGTDLVLSAAHCTYDNMWAPARKMKVVVGAHNIKSFDEPTKRRIPVRNYEYGRYDSKTQENDIILIRLKEVVPYTDYTRPVCLPDPSEGLPVGKKCFVSGWGTTSEGGTSSQLLRMVDINVYPEDKCYLNPKMFALMFCAGHEQGGKDSCQGDSGGPLVCQVDNKWVQYGVVSFGAGCARPGRPGVYAKVTNYIPWIQTSAKKLETSQDLSGGQEAESLYDGPSGNTGSFPTMPSTQTFHDSYHPSSTTNFGAVFNKPTADLLSDGLAGFQSPFFQNTEASSMFKPGGALKPGFSNSFSGFGSGFGSGLGLGKLPPGAQTSVSRDPVTGATTTTYTYSSSSGGKFPSSFGNRPFKF